MALRVCNEVAPAALRRGTTIGGPEQGQSESEFTLGLAESRSEFLKFEQGVIMKSGGSWQFVIAWEYDFAGGR